MSNKRKIALSGIGFLASISLLVISAILAEEALISAPFAVALTIISIILVIVRYIILNKRYNEYKKQFNRISQ